MELDDLDGIGPVTKKRLLEAGINTPKDMIAFGPVRISELCGSSVSVDTANKWIKKAYDALQEQKELMPTIRTATELLVERKNLDKITTGCKAIDDMLLGGIEVRAATELYGEFAAGKSQFVHTLCVMAQLPRELGGLNAKVMFVDSENTFRPERIVDIVMSRELVPLKPQTKEEKKLGVPREPENPKDLERFLDSIEVAKPISAAHQHFIMEHFGEIIERDNKDKSDEDPKIRLLIIDSLSKFFRGEYLGRGQLGARQIGLNQHITLISKLPELYNIAIVYTNQVLSDPSAGGFGDPTRPVGGNIVGHGNTYRIYLKKRGKRHVAEIVDSPYHPRIEVVFKLDRAGIVDDEEA